MPISKKVNKDFFKVWTPEMAYILGFFAADGYITVNRRGGQYWGIQIADRDLIICIRRSLKSKHRIGIKISKKKNESKIYRLQIGSIEMCNDLRKLGFTERKTKSITIPNIPREYFPHFVRGYFDGDGNIWIGKVNKRRKTPTLMIKISFTSCSKVFLEELQFSLISYGLGKATLYKTLKGHYRLQYSKRDTLKLCNIMYNSGVFGSLYLRRKKKKFDKFKTMRT